MPVEVNNKLILRFRTVLVVLSLALMLSVIAVLLRSAPNGSEIVSALSWPFVALAAVAGGKSAAEHLAAGGGIKGAVAALVSDAKPSEPK